AGRGENPAGAGQDRAGLAEAAGAPGRRGGWGPAPEDGHDKPGGPAGIGGGNAATLIARSAPTLGSTTNARCMAPRRVAARAVAVPAASPSESTKGPVSSGARSVSTPTL